MVLHFHFFFLQNPLSFSGLLWSTFNKLFFYPTAQAGRAVIHSKNTSEKIPLQLSQKEEKSALQTFTYSVCMVKFVTMDMNVGKIAPNSLNFAGSVTWGDFWNSHICIHCNCSFAEGRTQVRKMRDFSYFIDFDITVLITSVSTCIFTADKNTIYLKKNTSGLCFLFNCSEILQCKDSRWTRWKEDCCKTCCA